MLRKSSDAGVSLRVRLPLKDERPVILAAQAESRSADRRPGGDAGEADEVAFFEDHAFFDALEI